MYHRLGSLYANSFLIVLEDESEIRVPGWLGFGESPLPGCKLLTSCYPYMGKRKVKSSVGLFYEDTKPIPESSPLMTELPFQGPPLNTITWKGG